MTLNFYSDMMKKQLLLISFIITTFSFSQNKTIVPTSGTIVFERKEIITDSIKYLESIRNLNKLMISEFKKEFLLNKTENGEVVDTLQLKNIIESMPSLESFIPISTNEVKKFHHEFEKEKIVFFITQNEKKISRDLEINTKEIYIDPTEIKIQNNINGYETVTEYYGSFKFQYSNNHIIEIKENRNEKKVINGFNCFKVIYSFKETNDDFIGFTNTREMWVTEKIKTLFHPVIMEKKILEKYYPLEIVEYSDSMKGLITTYKLDKVDIK